MTDVDSTPAVVAYRVGQLEITIKEGLKEHNDKLDNLVLNYATIADLKGYDVRISSLEGDRKWLVRLVIGAVIFSLLALVGLGVNTIN